MAEEKMSTQENEFEESQMNEMEKEEVNSGKHHEEAHKKKEDKSCKKEDKQLILLDADKKEVGRLVPEKAKACN